MNILIFKLGAAGDVLRTTPLLSLFPNDHVTWVTSYANRPLLTLSESLTPVAWINRNVIERTKFDLAINLEDDLATASFLGSLNTAQIFGAYQKYSVLTYTEDSSPWFDMGIISRLGRRTADHLKWINRGSYQEILFSCLGHKFAGQPYLMPKTNQSPITGDVAICPTAGKTWQMKNWGGYQKVAHRLEQIGYSVNTLPQRVGMTRLIDHLADIRGHECLLSGDSLPMHAAIGYDVPSVTLFTCTSPWEIYNYGLQNEIVSSRLAEFFYSRSDYVECLDAIDIEAVVSSVLSCVPIPHTR